MVGPVRQLPPRGVSVALITPMTPAGEVDLPALDTLVARTLAGGVSGLSPTGSTGEGWRLSTAERARVTARVAAASGGRPIIAGLPCRAVPDTLDELRSLADAGASAALLAPPGPYSLSPAEVSDLFLTLADGSPLPLVLYHIPSLTGVGFTPAVVARLARHPRVSGLKDSSRDLEYLRRVVRVTSGEEFHVVTGTDALLTESLDAGAVGAVAPSPVVAPSWATAIFTGWHGTPEERATARRLQDDLLELVTACRSAGFPAGWKAAAALVGACGDAPVPPARPIDSLTRAELSQVLARLGLLAPRASTSANADEENQP